MIKGSTTIPKIIKNGNLQDSRMIYNHPLSRGGDFFMRTTNKITQFAIICEADPQLFQERLNDAMKRLVEKEPEATIEEMGDSLLAKIKYFEKEPIIQPEPSEVGAKFKCEDCPFFEPETKRDGTRDMRKKYGDCPYSEMHRTWKDSSACNHLYTMIKNGDIGLTLNKEPLMPILTPRTVTDEEIEEMKEVLRRDKK